MQGIAEIRVVKLSYSYILLKYVLAAVIIGTLRYTTARRYYGYHDRKGLGESTSRQSPKFSVRRKTN